MHLYCSNKSKRNKMYAVSTVLNKYILYYNIIYKGCYGCNFSHVHTYRKIIFIILVSVTNIKLFRICIGRCFFVGFLLSINKKKYTIVLRTYCFILDECWFGQEK